MTRLCVATIPARLAGKWSSRRLPGGTPSPSDGATYFRGDVTTGDGLLESLAGADVVIDCLEGQSGEALRQFAAGGALLMSAALEAGVAKAVLLSIINCDQSSYSFYRSKADKERVYARAALETATVRSTQFRSLVARLFSAGSRVGLVPVIRGVRLQTISPGDVAAALLEEVLEATPGQQHRLRMIGGPEIQDMKSMARTWKRVTRAKGLVAPLPLPGPMGMFLRGDQNLVPDEAYRRVTFEAWLAKRPENL